MILRPLAPSDVPFLMELNSDVEVVRYTGDAAFADEAEAREIVERLSRQLETHGMGRLLVLDRETGEKLGWCGLKWHEDAQVADLGYRFARRHWGRGYATEAGAGCVRYAFEVLGLPRLVAHAVPGNVRSVRVLEKLGFRRTGPARVGPFRAEGFELARP